MALRPGKIYSKPKGYKAFLTNLVDGDDRGKRSPVNRWGASRIPSDYKPGAGAPRAPVIEATETKEDMDARREAISKASKSLAGNSDHMSEVLAAVASHGTVEASQRGMYSARTVQAPSSSGEIAKGFEHLYGKEGGEGLTGRQKEGIERSVNAEIESRMRAKQTGAAYTGAHSAEEQQRQNLDYQNALVKQFGEAGAKERLGDRWVEDKGLSGVAKDDGGTRTFAPGIAGYKAPSVESAASAPTRPSDEDVLSGKVGSSTDDFIAAAQRQLDSISGGGRKEEPSGGPPPKEDEDDYASGATADAKGGQTSGSGPRPAVQPAPPESDEPQLVFGSREEAAAALMSRGAEMDYPTFAQAAAVASLPGPGDGPDYDPEDSFANLVTGRISDELLSLAERVEAYDARRENAYHSSNADAVAMAAGVSPEVYAAATPDERLYLQEKFMDSF